MPPKNKGTLLKKVQIKMIVSDFGKIYDKFIIAFYRSLLHAKYRVDDYSSRIEAQGSTEGFEITFLLK